MSYDALEISKQALMDPVMKEKLFHIISQGGLMGIMSPGDSIGERLSSAGVGALLGAMRVKNLSGQQLSQLQNQSFRDAVPDVALSTGLGSVIEGLNAYANERPVLQSMLSGGLRYGASDALFHGLNATRGRM